MGVQIAAELGNNSVIEHSITPRPAYALASFGAANSRVELRFFKNPMLHRSISPFRCGRNPECCPRRSWLMKPA